jgi:hypothetical protein
MATAQEIVDRACKRIGLFDAVDSVSGADLQQGLAALNEMISSWAADGLATADKTETARVTDGDTVVREIDVSKLAIGMFVSGAGIQAGTVIDQIGTPNSIVLSQAATASGAEVSLTFTALPFDASLERATVALLAVRLAEDYGKTPGPILLRDADRGEKQLQAAFLHVPRAQFDIALTRTPSQRYWTEDV